MAGRQPHVVVLGGPNGAGKSTAAPRLLRGALRVAEFVNADVVAAGLSGFGPGSAAIEAGRAMLTRLRCLAARRIDFAFEITMAGRSFVQWLQQLRHRGYVTHAVYVWVSSPELAVARVHARANSGGHDIEEDIIRRRYKASVANFFNLYRYAVDEWRFYDNSHPRGPTFVASGRGTAVDELVEAETWNRIVGGLDRD